MHPPVRAPQQKEHLVLRSQTEDVALTTTGHGQCFAGYDRAVVSADINGGSLTETSGCDGSILERSRGRLE